MLKFLKLNKCLNSISYKLKKYKHIQLHFNILKFSYVDLSVTVDVKSLNYPNEDNNTYPPPANRTNA